MQHVRASVDARGRGEEEEEEDPPRGPMPQPEGDRPYGKGLTDVAGGGVPLPAVHTEGLPLAPETKEGVPRGTTFAPGTSRVITYSAVPTGRVQGPSSFAEPHFLITVNFDTLYGILLGKWVENRGNDAASSRARIDRALAQEGPPPTIAIVAGLGVSPLGFAKVVDWLVMERAAVNAPKTPLPLPAYVVLEVVRVAFARLAYTLLRVDAPPSPAAFSPHSAWEDAGKQPRSVEARVATWATHLAAGHAMDLAAFVLEVKASSVGGPKAAEAVELARAKATKAIAYAAAVVSAANAASVDGVPEMAQEGLRTVQAYAVERAEGALAAHARGTVAAGKVVGAWVSARVQDPILARAFAGAPDGDVGAATAPDAAPDTARATDAAAANTDTCTDGGKDRIHAALESLYRTHSDTEATVAVFRKIRGVPGRPEFDDVRLLSRLDALAAKDAAWRAGAPPQAAKAARAIRSNRRRAISGEPDISLPTEAGYAQRIAVIAPLVAAHYRVPERRRAPGGGAKAQPAQPAPARQRKQKLSTAERAAERAIQAAQDAARRTLVVPVVSTRWGGQGSSTAAVASPWFDPALADPDSGNGRVALELGSPLLLVDPSAGLRVVGLQGFTEYPKMIAKMRDGVPPGAAGWNAKTKPQKWSQGRPREVAQYLAALASVNSPLGGTAANPWVVT